MPGVVAEEPDTRTQETQFSNLQDEVASESHSATAGGSGPSLAAGANPKLSNYGSVSQIGPSVGSQPQPNDSSAVPPATAASGRVLAPDLLRGLLMVFQSIDHAAVMLVPWKHGVANESEADGTPVNEWVHTRAWIARMLTHLCAPGFMFLLGMGIVYFGRSRTKLNWSASRMASHFVVRGLVLALVNELLGLSIGRGQFIIVNIVLLALAINYTLAGMLWLVFNFSETCLSRFLASFSAFNQNEDEPASQSLLSDHAEERQSNRSKQSSRAITISWHLHNVMYFALAAVTIWWNIWLSRDHGRCQADTTESPELLSSVTDLGPWFDFWFYPVTTRLVISVFPPLAWISFAILGLLYGRVILARPWPASTINTANAVVGLLFAVLFVATRLLHLGNLSEDCLHMPEQVAHPHRNQYLASFRSFFYVIKYPPSVAFLAFSVSLNFFFLAFFGALPVNIATRIPALMTFGTSALFFYVAHLLLYGVLGALVKGWFGHDLGYTSPITGEPAIGVGDSPAFWITWLVGLIILYPLCRWFSHFKSSKSANSIWRFF